MALEETLASIDSTLKAILTSMLSGAGAIAQLGAPDTAAAKPAAKGAKAGAKPTSENAGAVLQGDPEGTKYWMSKDERDFYTTLPGVETPPLEGLNNVSAAYLAAKRAESKKSSDAAAQKKDAAAAPSATQKQATASGPDFKKVVDALTELSKVPEPAGGRAVIRELLNKHLKDLPEAERKVPKLEPLGKHAEILAEVQALLAPPEVVAEDDDPFA